MNEFFVAGVAVAIFTVGYLIGHTRGVMDKEIRDKEWKRTNASW